MPQKPPAFQFYAKDWNSSPTVAKMSMHHRGIYITMISAAWDSDEPGTLPLPLEIAARSARLDIRCLRDFMAKFPRCFVEIGSKLVNEKLHENWLNYKKISEKRREAANTRYTANAEQMHHSASATASATAPERKEYPPTPLRGKASKKQKPFAYSDEFEQVWKAYPRHVGKGAAFKAFGKASINGDLPALLKSIDDHKPAWTEPQYIPHLATFLNQRRWEDEVEPRKKTMSDTIEEWEPKDLEWKPRPHWPPAPEQDGVKLEDSLVRGSYLAVSKDGKWTEIKSH